MGYSSQFFRSMSPLSPVSAQRIQQHLAVKLLRPTRAAYVANGVRVKATYWISFHFNLEEHEDAREGTCGHLPTTPVCTQQAAIPCHFQNSQAPII